MENSTKLAEDIIGKVNKLVEENKKLRGELLRIGVEIKNLNDSAYYSILTEESKKDLGYEIPNIDILRMALKIRTPNYISWSEIVKEQEKNPVKVSKNQEK